MEENEVELMDYLYILIKYKWFIIVPTFVVMVLVGIYSFTLPKIWEIDMLFEPGKVLVQTDQGDFKDIVITDPTQIAGRINEKSYDNQIAVNNKIDIKDFPRINAENIKGTALIRVSLREEDPNKAKLILSSLFLILKSDLDKKLEVETKGIETQIEEKKTSIKQNDLGIKDISNDLILKDLDLRSKDLDIQSKEIEKGRIGKEIESNKNKIKISEERVISLTDEMKSVKKRIDDLDQHQKKVLDDKMAGVDAISLLLYSSEVQQNLRYYDTLNDKMNNEKITQENLHQDSKNKEEQIKQLDNQINQIKTQKETINTLKLTIRNEILKLENINTTFGNDIKLLTEERKARIGFTNLIKSPTSSLYPVAPKKKKNVLIAGVIGGIIFTLLAFLLDYYYKQKKIRSKDYNSGGS